MCIWYTYNKDNKHCTLWRTCNEIVPSADGFVSGQKECPLNTGKEKTPEKKICMIQIDTNNMQRLYSKQNSKITSSQKMCSFLNRSSQTF